MRKLRKLRVHWVLVFLQLFFHAGALFALGILFFTDGFGVKGFAEFPLISWILLIILFFATGMGITVNNHRLLTHLAFVCKSTMLRLVLFLESSMAGQGPETYWVPIHRVHHAYSDRPEDPHSPLKFFPVVFDEEKKYFIYKTDLPFMSRCWRYALGLIWAQGVWTLVDFPEATQKLVDDRQRNFLNLQKRGLTEEERRDIKLALWQESRSVYLTLLFFPGFLLPALVGGTVESALHGVSAFGTGFIYTLLLAGFFRLIAVDHVTFAVNSLGHFMGEKPKCTCGANYEKTRARNARFWPTRVLSGAERNHGKHHVHPRCAFLGEWWEDPYRLPLVLFERLGWITDVIKPDPDYCPIHSSSSRRRAVEAIS